MANYPTSLDAFTNPTSVDSLSSPSHSDQHANANDAIEALEAKVGIGTSTAGSATAGHVLVASSGGTTSWTTVGASAISTTGGSAGQYLSAGTAGVAQWASITSSPYTLITNGSVTTQSTINFTNLLSDTYKFYEFTLFSKASTTASIYIKFRENTTDKSASYNNIVASATQGSSYGFWDTNTSASYISLGRFGTARNGHLKFTIYRPSATEGSIFGNAYDIANPGIHWGIGINTDMSNFTGLTILTSTGTITGSYSLVGYN